MADKRYGQTNMRNKVQIATNNILKMKRKVVPGETAFAWALLNCSLVGIIVTEMSTNTISRYCSIPEDYLWYSELALAALLAKNALTYIWQYYKYKTLSSVKLTPVQKNVLSVPISFDPSKPAYMTEQDVIFQGQNVLSHSTSWWPTTKTKQSFPRIRRQSFLLQVSPSVASLNKRHLKRNRCSCGMLHHLGRRGPSNNDLLRLQCHCYLPSSCCFLSNSEDYITDLHVLRAFLHKEEHRRQQAQLRRQKYSISSGGLSYSRLLYLTQTLTNYHYQVACLPLRDEPGSNEAVQENPVKLALGWRFVDHIDSWTGNLRKWIRNTILVPLVSEVECLNMQMKKTGLPFKIGESSIDSLRQGVYANSPLTPLLIATLPYLDMTLHQEYLWQRIKELSLGGCMSTFCWNGGSNFKGQKWDTYLPTDTAILMNVFCAYLDSRLPGDLRYPNGKTFTSHYFVQAPNKPDVLAENVFCIHQSNINPPHYKLVYQKHIFNFPEGRNNLFHTLLMFLYIIKTDRGGELGRANFGPSGVNILWIFDNC